ncbi:hypothetical protein CLF_103349 [Clonorchis sinensis]|uniref:Uncharacterized protein n=1 Tax=Clonorchis sinensis TaxID=79923 RepID=G7Y9L1_CLOSI|nr:hypothetical protein CLF_103349 [Clonorchis sinensis]
MARPAVKLVLVLAAVQCPMNLQNWPGHSVIFSDNLSLTKVTLLQKCEQHSAAIPSTLESIDNMHLINLREYSRLMIEEQTVRLRTNDQHRNAFTLGQDIRQLRFRVSSLEEPVRN